MENVSIDIIYVICLLATVIATRLLIQKILLGNESLISIFDSSFKGIVFRYYSVYLPFLLIKKIPSCSLCFIKACVRCFLKIHYTSDLIT